MTRIQRVTGYWRLIPDPLATPPHVEMFEVYRREQFLETLPEQIEVEMERVYVVEMGS